MGDVKVVSQSLLLVVCAERVFVSYLCVMSGKSIFSGTANWSVHSFFFL